LYIYIDYISSFPQLFDVDYIRKFTLVEVWENACHQLRNFFDLATLIYTMSKRVGTPKRVTPHNLNFGKEELWYLQYGLSENDTISGLEYISGWQ
jgi:hypothetical protein